MSKDQFTSLVQATKSTVLSAAPDGTHIHSKDPILQPGYNTLYMVMYIVTKYSVTNIICRKFKDSFVFFFDTDLFFFCKKDGVAESKMEFGELVKFFDEIDFAKEYRIATPAIINLDFGVVWDYRRVKGRDLITKQGDLPSQAAHLCTKDYNVFPDTSSNRIYVECNDGVPTDAVLQILNLAGLEEIDTGLYCNTKPVGETLGVLGSAMAIYILTDEPPTIKGDWFCDMTEKHFSHIRRTSEPYAPPYMFDLFCKQAVVARDGYLVITTVQSPHTNRLFRCITMSETKISNHEPFEEYTVEYKQKCLLTTFIRNGNPRYTVIGTEENVPAIQRLLSPLDAKANICVPRWICSTHGSNVMTVGRAIDRLKEISHNHYRAMEVSLKPPVHCYFDGQCTSVEAPVEESSVVDEAIDVTSMVDKLVEYLANHPDQRKEIICRLL